MGRLSDEISGRLFGYETILARGELLVAITKAMNIGEVVQQNPKTVRVFLAHGLMCIGCAAARFENIEQGAMAHGIDVDKLVEDLNQLGPEEEG